MTSPLLFVLLLGVVTLAAVYAAAGTVAVRWIVRRVRGQPAPKRSALRRVARTAAVSLAAAGAICLLYARFIEPFWLERTHVALATPKFPPGGQPLRIAHLSDLHCDAALRAEGDVVAAVAAWAPDLIVFTGDAVNNRAGLSNFRATMTQMARIAPTYAVLGNFDRSGDDLYQGTGVQVLDGRALRLEANGRAFWLVGAPSWDWASAEQSLRSLPAGEYKIVLYHHPHHVLEAARAGADLYLCGHTHGGQVALPFYGAIITLSKTGKRFEHGRYRVGATDMYVSRGIGMEGGAAPRIRFLARPEVVLIEIAPDGDRAPPRAPKEAP